MIEESKRLILLGMPLILIGTANVLMVFTDSIMLGMLGVNALASGALGFNIYLLFYLFSAAILMSVTIHSSIEKGKKDLSAIRDIVSQGIIIALLLAIIFSVILFNIKPLLLLLRQQENIIDGTTLYLRGLSVALVPAMLTIVLKEFSASIEKLNVFVTILLIIVPLNAVLNYLLMFGYGFIPKLGIAGVGWATAMVSWFNFLLTVLIIRFKDPYKHYNISIFTIRFRRKPFLMLLKTGWPIGIRTISEVGMFAVVTLFMGMLGAMQLASYHITMQAIEIIAMIPIGISKAVSIRVGKALGSQSINAIRQITYCGFMISLVMSVMFAVIFYHYPYIIIGLYLDLSDENNADIIVLATLYLSIGALYFLWDTVQLIACGTLLGLEDTKFAMYAGLFSYWVVGLLSGYVMAFTLDMGGRGLLYGLTLGLTSAAAFYYVRLSTIVGGLRYKENVIS